MIARRPARLLRSRPRLTLGLALSLVACTTGDGRAPDALQLLERDALAAEPARGGALQLLPKGQNPSEGALQIAAPVSLTASDGTGLRIVSFQARAVVEDPLAFTELRLTFRNPQNRQIEGNFEITLPPGAAISRFAMRQGDHWQEGEVVELQAARDQGLRGVGEHQPWFVARKDLERNTLWVVQGHDHPWLQSLALDAQDASWAAGEPPPPGTYGSKTRYRQADAPCVLVAAGAPDAFHLDFPAAQWAVTPGQSAVLYDDDVCLGGGVISGRS